MTCPHCRQPRTNCAAPDACAVCGCPECLLARSEGLAHPLGADPQGAGQADALGIDDWRFETLEARIVPTLTRAKGAAHVVVTITDAWRPPVIERGPDGMPVRMHL